ncbi:MAG: D-2-hydroxyacid dehydrogenase [Anaerolineales bacterium]|jgi:phosphoglycerate dehydrogenase-like enzyme
MSDQIEVLVTLPVSDELADEISQTGEQVSVTVYPAREGKGVPDELWQKAEVLYTMFALPKPEQAPNLRWVQSYLSGVEKLLEAPLFSDESEIMLTTLSGGNASQVAEHALTMMLALGRNLPQLFRYQQAHKWMEERGKNYIPFELRGSTVGVIGYGSIGRQVARIAHAFGAQVLATKRDLKEPEDSGYLEEDMGDPEGLLFTRLYPPQALRSMLEECDFAVVCVPLTRRTIAMIGTEQLKAMKPEAFLIDVSRGGVVDTDALVRALNNGELAGAALDVFAKEPLPENHPLWEMDNVIITPHVAGFSPAYNQRANQMFVENLKRYLVGDNLLNLVEPSRGY